MLLIILPILQLITSIILCVLAYQIGYYKCRINIHEKVLKPTIEDMGKWDQKEPINSEYRSGFIDAFNAIAGRFYKMDE